MQRAFSLPVIMIVIVLFLLLPLIYWQVLFRKNIQASNIKGVTDTNTGYSVLVSSSLPSWELYEYLCTTYDECTQSVTSGHFNQKVSGGLGTNQQINLQTSASTYSFVKLLIKPSFGLNGMYALTPNLDATHIQLFDEAATYNAFIVEKEKLPNDFSNIGTFSN